MTDRTDLIKSTNTMLATPNSASVVFGSDSLRHVRSKNLFYVRFTRPSYAGVTRDTMWREDVGFLCKSISKPTIQPQTEELSQYGKKRIITTGVKYDPVSLTLYDTSDSMAQQLWAEYAMYYFGAFNQKGTAWYDDVTSSTMNGSEIGFGFKTRPAAATPAGDFDTQHFFETIQIYEVWGGMYTQVNLLNPKISSYEPGEIDYEDSSASTVRMTLDYEGVVYTNAGKPMILSNSSQLTSVFNGTFSGQVLEVTGESYETSRNAIASKSDMTEILGDASSALSDVTKFATGILGSANDVTRVVNTVTGTISGKGVLSKFGNFNFGTTGIGKTLAKATSIVNMTQNLTNRGGKSLLSVGGGAVGAAVKNTGGAVQATTSGSDLVVGDYKQFESFSLTPDFYGATNAATDGTVQFGKNGTWT